MQYNLEKEISRVQIVSDGGSGYKAVIDVTVSGTAVHNGSTININDGITVELALPQTIMGNINTAVNQALAAKYIGD